MKKIISIGITMSLIAISALSFGQDAKKMTPEQLKAAKSDSRTNKTVQKKASTKKIKPVKKVPAKTIYKEKTSK